MKHRRLFVALTFASSLLAATANAGHLTRDNGAQVGDNQNSQTAGADGPVLLQDVQSCSALKTGAAMPHCWVRSSKARWALPAS